MNTNKDNDGEMPFTDVQERADGCCESENGKVRQLAPESVLQTQKLKSFVSSETREVPLQTGDLMESYTSVRFLQAESRVVPRIDTAFIYSSLKPYFR